MNQIFVTLILFFVTMTANAYVVPTYRDIKPATQVMLEYQRIPAPILADTDYVKETHAGAVTTAAVTITTFDHQPDVPRNITVTPTGTTTDVETCLIGVSGTNIYDAAITETISIAANASSTVSGVKAFKSVSSITWPANCESGTYDATWIIGVGDVLGLKRCMKQAGDVAWAVFDGAFESTRPTCVADADEVEKNTCDINGTLNGAKNVDLYFIQNFACKP